MGNGFHRAAHATPRFGVRPRSDPATSNPLNRGGSTRGGVRPRSDPAVSRAQPQGVKIAPVVVGCTRVRVTDLHVLQRLHFALSFEFGPVDAVLFYELLRRPP